MCGVLVFLVGKLSPEFPSAFLLGLACLGWSVDARKRLVVHKHFSVAERRRRRRKA